MVLGAFASFSAPARRLRPEVAALAIAAVAALGVSVLDVGSRAHASVALDRAGAVRAARAQGVRGEVEVLQLEADASGAAKLWRVETSAGDRAVVDAATGDLVEISFLPR
jgi:hypothetical protein